MYLSGKSRAYLIGGVLTAILVAGALFAYWAARDADLERRERLLHKARVLAQAIDVDLLRPLTGLDVEQENAARERLRRNLMAVRATHAERDHVCLIGPSADGEVSFYLDSEADSLSEQRHEQTADIVQDMFVSGRAAIVGPFEDIRGTWSSALVPITDPHSGRTLAVLGIYRDTADWWGAMARAVMIPFLSSLLLMLLAVVSFTMQAKRYRFPMDRRRRLTHLQVGLTATIGVVLTLSFAWVAYRYEVRHRAHAFNSFSLAKSVYVIGALHDLERLRVESLARFLEGSEGVTSQEFDQYSAYLARIPEVRAWCWVPIVPLPDRDRFEANMRENGLNGLGIWQWDETGHRIPATGREYYFPVRYMLNVPGHVMALGHDVGADPVRRAAMEEAMRTRLTSATDPVALLSDGQPGTLIFRSVFGDHESADVIGFAMAVLDWNRLLQASLGVGHDHAPFFSADLLQWDADEPPRLIASTSATTLTQGHASLTVINPILAFGKTYALVIRPTPDFMAQYPLVQVWFALLAGLSLTTSITLALALLMYGREELELQVADQTASLRQSVARFNELAAQNRVVIWELDLSGLYTYVSQEAEEVWGYRPEELVGKKYFYDLHPEDVREAFKAMAFQIIADSYPFIDLENPIQRGDGRVIWVSTNGVPIFGEQGEVTGYRGMDRDITSRKEAEERLHEEVIRHQILIEQSRDGIVVLEDNGSVQEANLRFAEMLGYSSEEVRQLHAWDWEHRISREELTTMLATVTEAGDHFETQHWRKDGSVFDVEISTNAAVVSGQKLIFCVCRDITERKKAEAERERLFTAMEQASESIIITDANGVIQYVNRYFETISGYTKEEALGKTPSILKSGKQDVAFYEALWRTIAAGNVWRGRLTNRRKDGSLYEEEMVITPVKDAAGRVTNHVAVKRDITREEELQRQLTHAAKMEAIGLLAGGVSHDFNNILTVILGNASLIQRSLPDAHPLQSETNEIVKAGMRAAELTRQLLSFSREQVVMPRHLDLTELIRDLQKMVKRLVPENIEITMNLFNGPLPVLADPGQIEQIILNLVVNACDALTERGVIDISTSIRSPQGWLSERFMDARVIPDEDMAVVSVSDNGTGIAPEHLENIFDPFYTTKEVGQGTGLGLSTAYGIVQQHNGTISVESEPGRGSTFRIYLPLSKTTSEPESIAETSALPRGSETILAVEDDPGVLSVVTQILQNLGYTVLKAGHGLEALEIARAFNAPIDLLLTDIIMPGMSGVALAEEIRRTRPGLTVVYASGYPADHLAKAGLSADQVKLVRKPFDEAKLALALRSALHQ